MKLAGTWYNRHVWWWHAAQKAVQISFLRFARGKVFRQAGQTLSRIPTWERVKRTFGGRLCVHNGPGMSGARSSALRMTCDLLEKLSWVKRGVCAGGPGRETAGNPGLEQEKIELQQNALFLAPTQGI